jgi:transcriptional regulator with XRE-family HTH domain
MKTEKSFYLIADVSGNTTSVREQLLDSFRTSAEYRHAFVEEKIRSGLAVQIKAIREQRGESQTSFAHMLNKSQSWVSRLEDPNAAIPTIPTLLIVARAFDVDLEVRFAPFSKLLDRLSALTPDSFPVPKFEDDCCLSGETTASFEEDLGFIERKGPRNAMTLECVEADIGVGEMRFQHTVSDFMLYRGKVITMPLPTIPVQCGEKMRA